MLAESEYTMNNLFAQLGLDCSDEAIKEFIEINKLPKGVSLKEAEIWNESQRGFLQEEWTKNSMWTQVIDDLNLLMSQDGE
ncbi:DUF2789 domain-containing protein [Thalassotalea piscium]|uniref:DUF2789 domain-containing protein n=1 Tax=Thalassotalea piscium TaxID=1230533 RepID=A0A7X0TU51_9GAMM|nr:DUF2789 domain-containing protein [Thalassotalea piscium]MBB6543961.1 hypothetical protein [Thalassotalea piscium]